MSSGRSETLFGGSAKHPPYRKECKAMRTKLSGPLDGLLKAWHDDEDQSIWMAYGEELIELTPSDSDRLLAVIEVAPSGFQAISDLEEFFEAEVSQIAARRMAGWFNLNSVTIDGLVYAYRASTNYGAF